MSNTTKLLTSEDSDLTKFSHNTSLLLAQLIKVYPDDQDLKIYADKYEWARKINARIPRDYFLQYLSPYIEKIMKKDETFFLTEINFDQYTDNEKYLLLIQKIMQLWQHSVDPKLKNNIWRYFQLLLVLAIKSAKRRDLCEKINLYRKKPLIL